MNESMNENQVNKYETVEKNAVGKTKNKRVIIVAVVLIIILGLLLGVYKFVINSPKNIFLRAINNEYNVLESAFDSLKSSNNPNVDTLTMDSSLNFDITVQDGILGENELALINEINELSAVMNTQYDSKNKQMAYSINLNHNTSDLLSFSLYGKTSSFYLDLKNYFDKYIEIPIEDYETLFENKDEELEDVKYIMSFLKNSFLDNLNSKDFKETKETIQIGSENVKTTKITYVFTEKNTIELISKMMEDMKKDDKFIESLGNVVGKDKDELRESIENALDSLDEVEESDNSSSVEVAVYTKGIMNKTVQCSLTIKDDESNYALRYSNYKDVKRFSVLDDLETILHIENSKEKENTYKTTVTASTIKLVIDSIKKDDDWSHTYKLSESESTLAISGEVATEVKEITKDKEYKIDTKFTASIGVDDMEDIVVLTITSNNTSKIGEVITIPDVSNSVLYTNLTEEEMNTIMTNILNDQNLINFINKISSYMVSDDYEEDDYEYYDNNDY